MGRGARDLREDGVTVDLVVAVVLHNDHHGSSVYGADDRGGVHARGVFGHSPDFDPGFHGQEFDLLAGDRLGTTVERLRRQERFGAAVGDDFGLRKGRLDGGDAAGFSVAARGPLGAGARGDRPTLSGDHRDHGGLGTEIELHDRSGQDVAPPFGARTADKAAASLGAAVNRHALQPFAFELRYRLRFGVSFESLCS